MTHPYVMMADPFDDGREVEIDEHLAPLIAELWRLGVSTYHCCQGRGAEQRSFDVNSDEDDRLIRQRAWPKTPKGPRFEIGFESFEDARCFHRAVWESSEWPVFTIHWTWELPAGPACRRGRVIVKIPCDERAQVTKWLRSHPAP
jgi:hypothetical protein